MHALSLSAPMASARSRQTQGTVHAAGRGASFTTRKDRRRPLMRGPATFLLRGRPAESASAPYDQEQRNGWTALHRAD